MKLMLWVTFIIIGPVVILAVYFQIDPLHVLMEGNFYRNKILIILFRSIIALLVAFSVMAAINSFFIVGLMVVCATNDMLRDLRESNLRHDLIRRYQEIHLCRKLFLWNKYTNQNFCSFSVPPLIFFGISVIVLAYFGSIRIWGKVSLLLYLVLPTICLFGTCFVLMMIPQAARVVEFSEHLISSRINGGNTSKFERRTWKSMRPLGIQVGGFGSVQKSLKMLACKYISENTVDLLLAF